MKKPADKDYGIMENEFIVIPGRTNKKIDVGGGFVTIRNCSPAKAFVTVTWEEK